MIIAALLAVTGFALLSLASGAEYLDVMLPGGLPLGNLLTALGLCSAAGVAFRLSRPATALGVAAIASLVGAGAWLPASILLAGNLSLNFSGWRGTAWLLFSLVVALVVISTLAWALLASLLAMRRGTDPDE